MNPLRLVATATATSALVMLVVSPTMAAAADPTDKSKATLTITGGTLDLTVESSRRTLGKASSSDQERDLSGRLGEVVVSDRRGAPEGSGWVANVSSTPFKAKGGAAIPARQVSYTVGPIAKQGIATYAANNPDHLQRPTAAVTATDITGNNTATWTPTIEVRIPPNAPAGTYTATITHSVL